MIWRVVEDSLRAIHVGAMNTPKYPHVEVQLTGTDGNAYAVLGEVQRALQRAGVGQVERDAFYAKATASDYDNLFRTCCAWVEVS